MTLAITIIMWSAAIIVAGLALMLIANLVETGVNAIRDIIDRRI